MITGQPGSGKEIANSEPILTPSGVKKVKDIKVGDTLIGKDGLQTTVLGVFPQGKKQVYEFKTADGRILRCGKNHQFTVGHRSHGTIKWEVMTIGDLLDKGLFLTRDASRNKTSKYFIPNNDCVQFTEQKLEISPYVIGAFLGNGCRSIDGDTLFISSGDDFVPKKIAKLLTKQLGRNIITKKQSENNYTYAFYFKETNKRVHAIHLTNKQELIALLTGCYSHEKYIPIEYKYSSEKQRYELLQGLMDTDGTIGLTPRFNMEYHSGSKRLIEDIKEVFRSMGNMYVSEIKEDTRKKNPTYATFINCDNSRKQKFFSTPKKLERAKEAEKFTKNRHYNRINIKSITDLGYKEESTCFTVDAKDSLYIAGDTVVTHNTFAMVNFAASCISMGQRIIAIDPKDDFIKLQNIMKDVEVIDVNDIRPGSLNPFTFLRDCTAITLMTIIEILLGDITREDKNALIPILTDFMTDFRKYGNYTDLQDVVDFLHSSRNDTARAIGQNLRLNQESKFGKLLFTRERDIEPLYLPEDKSLVISILGMALPPYGKHPTEYNAEERFSSAILYILTSKLREILSTKSRIPTTIFCDEAHSLFANEQMSEIISEFLRKGRSLNIAMVLGSQAVGSFPDDISQYISTKFCFKSSMEDAGQFLDKFDVSKLDPSKAIDRPSVIGTIAELPTGCCYMIDWKNRSGIIRIVSIYDISLLTSNPLSARKKN